MKLEAMKSTLISSTAKRALDSARSISANQASPVRICVSSHRTLQPKVLSNGMKNLRNWATKAASSCA